MSIKNTYTEPTNKFIELDDDEKLLVTDRTQRLFGAIQDKVLNPNRAEKLTFEKAVTNEINELHARILFLEKERDAYKRQVK